MKLLLFLTHSTRHQVNLIAKRLKGKTEIKYFLEDSHLPLLEPQMSQTNVMSYK